MSLEFIIWLTAVGLCLSLFLQSFELLILSFRGELLKIWSFENLKEDLKFKFLFGETSFKLILVLEFIAAIWGMINPSFVVIGILFLTHLLICIRFRGTFNGGSDMMTFVLLTGVFISLVSESEDTQKLGLIYITINTLYSYFKAGLSKIRRSEWRSGEALAVFSEGSLFPDVRTTLGGMLQKKWLAQVSSWGVILFEILVIVLPFFTDLSLGYFVIAVLFHACVFLTFGLNRFFWVWASAWPCILYCLNLISEYR